MNTQWKWNETIFRLSSYFMFVQKKKKLIQNYSKNFETRILSANDWIALNRSHNDDKSRMVYYSFNELTKCAIFNMFIKDPTIWSWNLNWMQCTHKIRLLLHRCGWHFEMIISWILLSNNCTAIHIYTSKKIEAVWHLIKKKQYKIVCVHAKVAIMGCYMLQT